VVTKSLVLGAILFLSGCISVSSGERTVRDAPGSPTLGQQLMDLKAEYDRGTISEREYNERRDRLLGK
jgi:PBP1b-binding outer membrane lipoprotein LpoB